MQTKTLLVALVAVALCSSLVCGQATGEAHRLVQYAKVASGEAFGSAGAGVAGEASRDVKATHNRVLFVTLEQLASYADKLEQLYNGTGVRAVVITMPTTAPEASTWAGVEAALFKANFGQIPVYFITESESLRDSLARVGQEDGSSSGDSYQVVIAGSSPSKVQGEPVANYQGWLAGSGTAGSAQPARSMAFVAHYDALSAVPTMAYGADDSASGATAVLELARLFSKLYAESRGEYGMLFLLTAAGQHNYLGAQAWLEKSSGLLPSVEFVLCLDSLGHGDKLYLHVSKPRKSQLVKDVYGAFEATAERMQIPFQVVRKKINVGNPVKAWQHEHFAMKKLLAATLSSRAEAVDEAFARPNMFDTEVDMDVLVRNIRFVAESVVAHVYGYRPSSQQEAPEVFAGELGVSRPFVEEWHRSLSGVVRMQPVGKEAQPVLRGMETTLWNLTSKVGTMTFLFQEKSEYDFWQASPATLTIYQDKSVYFDLVLAVAVVAYLVLLHVLMVGPSAGIHNLLVLVGVRGKYAKLD